MTKEEILIKALNDRCKYESSKEMDYNTHLAIMDAMDEYAQQQVKPCVISAYQEIIDMIELNFETIGELIEAGKNGSLTECFGCGTAAVVSPVGELKYEDTVISINDGKIGTLTQKFYDTITGIQSGKVEDTYSWITKI